MSSVQIEESRHTLAVDASMLHTLNSCRNFAIEV